MKSRTLDFFRSLPPSDTNDGFQIAGNASTEVKCLTANFLAHAVGVDDAFAAKIGARIRMIQIDISKRDGSEMEARVVCEAEVEKDMLNSWGTMHGACGAYLVDTFTEMPVIALGIANGEDRAGMSQNMNLVYHSAPRVGATLRCIGTTITGKGRLMASHCEIYDKSTERILLSGVQTLINPGPKFSHREDSKL